MYEPLTPTEDTAQQQAIGLSVDRLEAALLSTPEALVEEDVVHLFTDKLYTRQAFVPAGTIVTTKIHKTQHPFMLVFGKVSVYNAADDVIVHLQGPYMGVTEPGTRRVAYVHEDALWITFHVNEDNEQDFERLENRYVERHELTGGRTARELADELRSRLLEGS